jgi:membrane protein required for colicin V production
MFDIGVVLASLFFGLKGLLGGVLVEITSFIGILGGIFVASRVAKPLASNLVTIFAEANIATIETVVFFIVFGLFLLISKILTKYLLQKDVDQAQRVLGFLVAAVKYFLIFSIIVSILSATPLKKSLEKFTLDSKIYTQMVEIGKVFLNRDDLKMKKKSTK